MNYTELVAALKGYMNNYSTEFNDNINTVIRQAEARVVRATDLRVYRRHATALATPGDPYMTLPDDVLSIRYLRIRSGDFLESRPESWMSEYNQTVTTQGIPKYYGHWDHATVVMAPAPNAAINIELSYKTKPDSIVTATTTWLGDNAEDCLLAACVVEAALFLQLQADIMLPLQERLKEAVDLLQKQESSNASDEFMSRTTV
jgi:hypothetical protein